MIKVMLLKELCHVWKQDFVDGLHMTKMLLVLITSHNSSKVIVVARRNNLD
jgi:hypothetical protein